MRLPSALKQTTRKPVDYTAPYIIILNCYLAVVACLEASSNNAIMADAAATSRKKPATQSRKKPAEVKNLMNQK